MVRRLTLDIVCKHTKFDEDISWGVKFYNSSSGDEIPERNMITYLPLNYDTCVVLRDIFEVTRTYIMDVGLRKAPCVSCYYPLSVFLAWTILLSAVSRFIQEAPLTQRDREHTLSWNRVKCCISVRQIAFEKACNRSCKVTAVAAIWLAIYDFLLAFHCKYISVLHRFRDINTYLPTRVSAAADRPARRRSDSAHANRIMW